MNTALTLFNIAMIATNAVWATQASNNYYLSWYIIAIMLHVIVISTVLPKTKDSGYVQYVKTPTLLKIRIWLIRKLTGDWGLAINIKVQGSLIQSGDDKVMVICCEFNQNPIEDNQ